MSFSIKKAVSKSVRADAVVLCLDQSNTLDTLTKEFLKLHNITMGKSVKALKKGQSKTFHFMNATPSTLIFHQFGDKKDLNYHDFRMAFGDMSRTIQAQELSTLLFTLPPNLALDYNLISQAIAEGLIMGTYQYKKHSKKKEDKKSVLKHVSCLTDVTKMTNVSMDRGAMIGVSVNVAKDLANSPANILTPKAAVNEVKKQFKGRDITVEVIDEKKAASLKMGSFLSVGRGSKEPSYMLDLTYGAQYKTKPICLVGKGVTFDSGGISIKPSSGMSKMKGDMGGAAAVIGAMNALSLLKPKVTVRALVPLVENMPSSQATKPGDVVTAMDGQTIEVLNTDAEGRLILADALCYALKQKPKVVIDIATLTGAALVALGNEASAFFTKSDAIRQAFKDTESFTGDRLWELPLYSEYKDLLKSDVADLSNCYEGRLGGTCTAAKFLEQFVGDCEWAHIDMAPVMEFSSTKGCNVKGMSGSGVRNFVDYIVRTYK